MVFAEVILPLALEGTFTYHVPESWVDKICPGMRVEVSFGKTRSYSGIVHHLHGDKPSIKHIKPIESLIDDHAIISSTQLDFWDWVSEYYMCSLGEVMDAALPAYLKLTSETIFYLNPYEEFEPSDFSDNGYLVYEALQTSDFLTRKDIEEILNHKNVYSALKELQDMRAVYSVEDLKDRVKPKKEKLISIPSTEDEQWLAEAFGKLKNAPKQEQLLLQILHELRNTDQISKSIIRQLPAYSPSAYKTLVQKRILTERTTDVSRIDYESVKRESLTLSPEQNQVYQDIRSSKNPMHLIQGITGSGKTYIYLQLIQDQISQGKQCLYLVPEIALTTQLIQHLLRYLGNDLVVFHSKFNAQERVEVYNAVREGKAKVILGVRSAIFLPFSNLGSIIIDEEQEGSYKQYNPAPRYNARDAALHLAQKLGAQCILGSATPSLYSLLLAQQNKLQHHQLVNRYSEAQLPTIEIVDSQKEHQNYKEKAIFTPTLLAEMEASLKRGKQVILFQNRRGYNPFVICYSCGSVPSCEHCDVSLTYHKYIDRLLCHYCSETYPPLNSCPTCGQASLSTSAFGTERIEDEVQKLLPHARVARMDYDTTRNKKAHERNISQFAQHKIDILIGTQMIAKGLHFEDVDLVGIVSADAMMSFPDFRAHEKAMQTWIQVAGRAGRSEGPSKVLLQTKQPQNKLIKQFQQQDYDAFVRDELQERKEFIYPPYCKLIHIVFRDRNYASVQAAALHFYEHLHTEGYFSIKKPKDAGIARIRNKYIMETYAKIPRKKSHIEYTKKVLEEAKKRTKEIKQYKYVDIYFDVDPL